MNTILRILKYKYTKYVLTAAAFAVWMAYFDNNDWFTQRKNHKELASKKAYIKQLRAEIAEMKKQRDGMEQDPVVLEKFARENYRLKRDNEDIYVFE